MEMWNCAELDLGEKKQEGVCREHVRNFNIYFFSIAQHENAYTMKHISKVIICMKKST